MARRIGGAGGILSYFTRHATAANLVLVLMIAAGIFALPRMRAQFFPDVVVDSVRVSVAWAGAGAEDVDRAIVQLLEPALLEVEDVSDSRATAVEGSASFRLEFEPGTPIEQATEDVQAAVDAVNDLPDDADEPQVRRGGWSDRVTLAVITGPVEPATLGRFADEFVQLLFERGVTNTQISGVAAPSTLVEVPSIALVREGVEMADIAAAIAREVRADPAGDLSNSVRIRTGEATRGADEIAAITLRQNPDGTNLTIGDVARVVELGADRDGAFFVGDDPAVQVQINRSEGGDAIAIEDEVIEAARELEATLPQGVRVDLTDSRAEVISARLSLLLDNAALGLALVLGLLFLFLNARTAIWVAFGIPVSLMAAVALMYAFGLSLNMISLFALILTLGIVVDDAIVVGEHADFRARRLGEAPVVAAERAAERMFSPVFSATLTTIIAFFGLVAIGGRFGDFIADIPVTVIAVLLASLVECFLILPNHLAHSVGPSRLHWYDRPSQLVNRGFRWVRDHLFKPLMRLVIVARYPVIAGALLLLASQAALLVRGDVQWRFFSSPEQSSVTGNFAMLPGATRADTLEMMREMQRATEAVATDLEDETGANPLRYVIAQVGGNAGRGLSGADQKDPDQLGAITIELIDADSRPYSSDEFVQRLQEAIVNHPLTETVSFRSWGSGPGGDEIEVELSGAEPATLKAAAEALKAELMQIPEVSGPEDSLPYDKEELILNLTSQGRALGFTIDELGRILRQRLSGIEAATYPAGPRSAEIRVELPEEELTADILDRTLLRTAAGGYVPLADIVSVERRTGFSTVERRNGVAQVEVIAGLDDENADRAAEIMTSIAGEILPRIEAQHDVTTELAGLAEQEREFLNDARTALIFSLVGIYLVLAWIFASWTRPLIVMAIIPFGLIGAVWGHWLWDVPFSMFTVIGLIGMVGIIINDSIVLVTTIDEYAEERGLFPAIVEGTADRLRPVFLTTATTVLGLAPLLYEGSTQAEFLKPTVIALVYGLGFGMILVLCVVPALLAAQSDVSRRIGSAARAARSRRGGALPVRTGAGAAMLLFAVIMLPVILTGAALSPLQALVPALSSGGLAAFGLFAAALGVVLLVIYAAAALSRRPRTG